MRLSLRSSLARAAARGTPDADRMGPGRAHRPSVDRSAGAVDRRDEEPLGLPRNKCHARTRRAARFGHAARQRYLAPVTAERIGANCQDDVRIVGDGKHEEETRRVTEALQS